jgi:hypothetical protein
VRGKIDLYSDRRKSALVHTIVLSPQASYKDGKKKLYFSISNGEFTENHFRVDSKGDKEQWKEYIYLALSVCLPEVLFKSTCYPSLSLFYSRRGTRVGVGHFPPRVERAGH